jgi:sugar phosphate isomerase/epimerase
MKTFTRRQFLGAGALGILAARYMTLDAQGYTAMPFNWPLSFQSWGVKDMLAKDFDNTLHQIAALGYKGIEMCSPRGYDKMGFGPLVSLTIPDMRRKIEDAGLFCKTCHYVYWELQGEALKKTISNGKELGLKDLVISSAPLGDDATLDDWKKITDEMNKAGEVVRDAGLQLVYHNHTIGPEIEGVQLYDHLMQLFDPKLIKMQFQLACISEGFDVIEYLAKYPGRYFALHMHDWDPVKKKIVPIGQGVIDWKKLLTTAKASGISEYGMIVELESRPPDDPFDALAISYTYLNNLKL